MSESSTQADGSHMKKDIPYKNKKAGPAFPYRPSAEDLFCHQDFPTWTASVNIDNRNPCNDVSGDYLTVNIQLIAQQDLYSYVSMTFKFLVESGVFNKFYEFTVLIPAKNITCWKFDKIPEIRNIAGRMEHLPSSLCTCHTGETSNESFCKSRVAWSRYERTDACYNIGAISLQVSKCIIIQSNTEVPRLAKPKLAAAAKTFLEALKRKQPHEFRILFHRSASDGSLERCSRDFNMRLNYEVTERLNPLCRWYHAHDDGMTLAIENILEASERPQIHRQPQRIKFLDKYDYQVTHAYSLTMEQEYEDNCKINYELDRFDAKFVHLPGSTDPVSGLPTSYLCLISSKGHKQLVPLQDNDTAILELQVEQPRLQTYEFSMADMRRMATELRTLVQEKSPTSEELRVHLVEQCKKLKGDSYTKYIEKHQSNDECQQILDYVQVVTNNDLTDAQLAARKEREDFKMSPYQLPSGPNGMESAPRIQDLEDDRRGVTHLRWEAWKIPDATLMCPDGYEAWYVHRPKEPGWTGATEDQPLVLTNVTSIPATYNSVVELHKAIEAQESVSLIIKLRHERKPYKDQINALEILCHSRERYHQEMCAYLVDPTPHGKCYDFLERISDSPFQANTNFEQSQQDTFKELGTVRERLFIVNACPGSGKTYLSLHVTLSFLANRPKPDHKGQGSKTRPNRVLFVSSSNTAVDDACSKFAALAVTYKGKSLKVIRLHSLGTEKAKFLEAFAPKIECTARVNQDEAAQLANEHYIASFMHDINQAQEKKLAEGDPRRKLVDFSLTNRMCKQLFKLHDLRNDYKLLAKFLKSREPLSNKDTDEKERLVERLMRDTLAAADVVFTTIGNASKAALNRNFEATLIIADEAARATELQIITLVALYRPHIIILAGDNKQMIPTVKTASLSESIAQGPQVVNSFVAQLQMPLFTRLQEAGHPASKLLEHHRCAGGLMNWANKCFYGGEMRDKTELPTKNKDGLMTTCLHPKAEAARNLMRKICPAMKDREIKVNRVLINVANSKSFRERNATSWKNMDHVQVAMTEIKRILDDPTMKGQHITVLPLYKAQVALYKAEFLKLSREQQDRLGSGRVGDPRTGDSAQGFEDDIIIVDFGRQSGVGFTGEARRMNVLMTRARYLQIIIMNKEGMKKGTATYLLDHSEKLMWFHQLVKDCEQYGLEKKVVVKPSAVGGGLRTGGMP